MLFDLVSPEKMFFLDLLLVLVVAAVLLAGVAFGSLFCRWRKQEHRVALILGLTGVVLGAYAHFVFGYLGWLAAR